MPGVPIDPDLVCDMAQDSSYTYAPTAGAWARDGSMWCIDATGRLVTTNDAGALRVYADAADKLARSSGHTNATFTTSGVVYQLVPEGAEAVAAAT